MKTRIEILAPRRLIRNDLGQAVVEILLDEFLAVRQSIVIVFLKEYRAGGMRRNDAADAILDP